MSVNVRRPNSRSIRQLTAAIAGFLIITTAPLAHGQITLDGSMGAAGALTGPNYTIPSSLGQTRGGNLFHSFGLFNVLTNQRATFTGPNSISNIFGRVTGGQPSTIDGTIRSTIPNANLYLMNPAGVLLGPNASLDVRGSFHVTTADYLKFADGARFHADLSRQSTLTTAPVSAFGFLSRNPAGITAQRSLLQLPPGATMSLVGGDIDIVGDPFLTSQGFPTLSAFGGKVQLASVAAPGEVPLNFQDLNVGAFERLGEINLSNAAYVDVGNYTGGAVGTVIIRGGRLVVDSSFVQAQNVGSIDGLGAGLDIHITGAAVLTNQSVMAADSFGAGRARDVQITAGTLHMDNSEIRSISFESGNSGNVSVDSGSLVLTGRALIDTRAFASGHAGSVQVTASDSISLDKSLISSSNLLGSTGNAGDVMVDVKNLTATGGGQLFSGAFGAGNGGSVRVTASGAITLSGTGDSPSGIFASSETGATGNAGNIIVTAKDVTLTGGAQIFGGTAGSGGGGTVQVNSSDTVILDGAGSQIAASSQFGSSGNAGNVLVQAKNVTLADQAVISGNAFGSGKGGTVQVIASETVSIDNGRILAQSEPGSTGDAGNLLVEAKNVAVAGGGQIATSTFGAGNAGALQVTAADTISLDGFNISGPGTAIPSGIFSNANPGSTGNAGNLVLATKNLTVTGGAQIGSGTFAAGSGGTMRITASGTLSLDGSVAGDGFVASSGIFTNAQPTATGKAADLVIAVGNLSITGGAVINSGTFGPGKGGNVQITATDSINLDGVTSGIRASAGRSSSGDAGNITLKAKSLSLDGSDIDTNTAGRGKAGDVVIEVDNLTAKGGAQISSATFGAGKGGTVRVTAANSISLDGTGFDEQGSAGASGIFANANPGSSNDAGDLVVGAKNLTVTGGAAISAVTFGSGKGGTINVTASDKITLDGLATVNGVTAMSQISSAALSGSTGNAGGVTVSAGSISMTNGAAIFGEANGTGNGGTVRVFANGSLDLDGGAIISSRSSAQGLGGSIDLRARRINLNDHALISATSSGSGDAGNIAITAADSFRSVNSSVTTAAETADGGNIHLTVGWLVELIDSQITATVKSGVGSGGNITIDPQFVVLNHSQITANAFGGPGGNITIVANNFLASSDSGVTASSALSTPGTVDIQAPITDLSGSLAPLPESIVQASSLLRQSCAARFSGGKLSSLAAPGRGGMPFEPGGWMPSPIYPLTDASILTQAEIPTSNILVSAKPLYSIVSPCGMAY